MRCVKYLWFVSAFTLLLSPGAALAQQAAVPAPDAGGPDKLSKLNWEVGSGTYTLPKSSSTIRLGVGLAIVRGPDARKLMRIAQGKAHPAIEAVIVDPDTKGGIIAAYYDSGYVHLRDWRNIDPDRLLERIGAATAEANVDRRRFGLAEISIAGWLREPTLNYPQKSVSWAIEARDGEAPVVNAITLKLGRKGFEKLTWIGGKDLYFAKRRLLEEVSRSHRFDDGFRYGDFADGDKRAATGIATLVSAAAGAPPPDPDTFYKLAVALADWIWLIALVAAGITAILIMRGRLIRRARDAGA